MIKLSKALAAWNSIDFKQVLKDEINNIDITLLPLQQGLSQTSYASDEKIDAVILNVSDTENSICVKTGIFYAGTNAGSCCADDPTAVSEQTEYCEIQFNIDKNTAETTVSILKN